jgi:hypothetical protein
MPHISHHVEDKRDQQRDKGTDRAREIEEIGNRWVEGWTG